jgi:hypothetical protein
VDAHLDFGTLEAVGTWIMWVKDEVHRNEEDVVKRVLVEGARLVEKAALLVDLKALLGDVYILDWSADGVFSVLCLGRGVYCLRMQPGAHCAQFVWSISVGYTIWSTGA